MLRLLFVMFSIFFIFACKERPSSTLQEIGNAVVIEPLQKSEAVARQAELAEVKKTINEYYALNGKYPDSLADLKTIMGKEFDSHQYDYDPQSGAIRLKTP